MNIVRKLTLAMALLLGAAPAALAQSDYTTGTISNSVTAGYPSPYGAGSGLYAYAPFGARGGGRQHGHAWLTSARSHNHALY
jgi:hypothetical protein